MTTFKALNVIDFAVLPVDSVVSLADGTPALVNGKVSGKTVRRMLLTVASAGGVSWRADGTDPTAGTGHILAASDTMSFTGANYKSLINAIKFIKASATTEVMITYFD